MQESMQAIFSSYEGKENELIPILQQTQEEFGYLPEEAMLDIARFTGVPESRVYSVGTFYAQFRFTPIGRNHIMVCRGTACHVRGAPRILQEIEKQLGIKEGETTPDMEFSLETVACIGACGLAPNMVVNKTTYGRLTTKRVSEVLNSIRSREAKEEIVELEAKDSTGEMVEYRTES
jgi:NADH-quinone oxidoreductase subunit E